MFKITVIEILSQDDPALPDDGEIKRYEQTVDLLDLAALTAMVNRKPRTYTKRAKKDPGAA